MKKLLVLVSSTLLFVPLLSASASETLLWNSYSNIAVDKQWKITLNDEIDPATVANNVYVLKGEEKIAMETKVQDNVLLAKPSKNLQPNTNYTLVVTDQVENVEGESLEANLNVPFTTKKADVKETVPSYKTFVSEYGFTWHMASSDYTKFYLTGVDAEGNIVAGHDTRKGQNLFGISIGAASSTVTAKYGQPLERITKNNRQYVQSYVNSYGDTTHGTYLIDGKYVTFFYDVHANNTVRAITWVDERNEAKKTSFFATGSTQLRDSFEGLMLELMNQSRVAAGLKPLTYTPNYNYVGRAHSQDMIDKNYFAHENKEGLRARERMTNAGIQYQWFGENLAYGQYSAIYAHEALMNSLGHRENILRDRFTHALVGVAFKDSGAPYFTINFYQK